MNDLFCMKASKKDQLLEFIRLKGAVWTHEVIDWGIRNKTNTAERSARLLAEEGFIRRMTKEERNAKYWWKKESKEDVWIAL